MFKTGGYPPPRPGMAWRKSIAMQHVAPDMFPRRGREHDKLNTTFLSLSLSLSLSQSTRRLQHWPGRPRPTLCRRVLTSVTTFSEQRWSGWQGQSCVNPVWCWTVRQGEFLPATQATANIRLSGPRRLVIKPKRRTTCNKDRRKDRLGKNA